MSSVCSELAPVTCTDCALSSHVEEPYTPGVGSDTPRAVVVTKFMPRKAARDELLRALRLPPTEVTFLAAIKCTAWDATITKAAQKACLPYLDAEIQALSPEAILCLGAEALFAVTGKGNPTRYRGTVIPLTLASGKATKVVPTVAPAAVSRNPGLAAGYTADIETFLRVLNGTSERGEWDEPKVIRVAKAASGLAELANVMRSSAAVSFDVETNGIAEFLPDSVIVSIAFTCIPDATKMDGGQCWAVPLCHRESPWVDRWKEVLARLFKYFQCIPVRIGHNAKFDSKWGAVFGFPSTFTEDTLIQLAVLDENQPKSLKTACRVKLGVDPWGIDTSNLLDEPLGPTLKYNGLDTWYTARLWLHNNQEFESQPRLHQVYREIPIPMANALVPAELLGVWADQGKLQQLRRDTEHRIGELDEELLADYVPDHTYWPPGVKAVNFRPSNFSRWLLFEHLGLPVLARGKAKPDGSPGDPSLSSDVMKTLAQDYPVASLLVERAKLSKRVDGFYRPWLEQLAQDPNSRLHTSFKPWGTVTGRLSSGKEDTERAPRGADSIGVNLQQIPRGKDVKCLLGAPLGSVFMEFDYSQVELRIAAYLAEEPTMLGLYARGEDIHLATAMNVTGKAAQDVLKEERTGAKGINFGFLYGMGANKFVSYMWTTFGQHVTDEYAQGARDAYFRLYRGLRPWHARQRAFVRKYGFVRTPLGRIRHLPDINSPDEAVRSGAERQAINSPVQSFASDLNSLSFRLVSEGIRERGLKAQPVGAVHDAILVESSRKDAAQVAALVKHTMEHLPLFRLFGVDLTVPLVADVKVGPTWGDAVELPGKDIEAEVREALSS